MIIFLLPIEEWVDYRGTPIFGGRLAANAMPERDQLNHFYESRLSFPLGLQ
jgi:hypothetical protein